LVAKNVWLVISNTGSWSVWIPLSKLSSHSVDIPPTEEESGEIAELNAFASASHSTHKACKLGTSHSFEIIIVVCPSLFRKETIVKSRNNWPTSKLSIGSRQWQVKIHYFESGSIC